MTTIDQLLINIVNNNFDEVKKIVLTRDSKVLLSLGKIIISPTYITENQGRLILKILNQYRASLEPIVVNLSEALQNPTWAKSFRPIDNTKKLYVSTHHDGTSMLTIEFAFSAALRKLINSLSEKLTSITQQANG